MEKPFETSLAELEAIVCKLESGDLPLEDSLELFEKGSNSPANAATASPTPNAASRSL